MKVTDTKTYYRFKNSRLVKSVETRTEERQLRNFLKCDLECWLSLQDEWFLNATAASVKEKR